MDIDAVLFYAHWLMVAGAVSTIFAGSGTRKVWTEREVLKTVRTADPAHEPNIEFFYHLQLPHERFEKTSRPLLRYSLLALTPILEAIGRAFPKQSNEFGFLIKKSEKLHPWLEHQSGQIIMNPAYAAQTGRVYQAAAPDAPWWRNTGPSS